MPCREFYPLTVPTLLDQVFPHPFTQVPLQLDGVLGDRAAGSARALQLLRELLQKRLVVREVVDDGDGLAAAPLLLHPELRDDTPGHGLVNGPLAAALAVLHRPSAPRTDSADPGGIDNPSVAHPLSIA